MKMTEDPVPYEVVMATPGDQEWLQQASALIGHYAGQGLMIAQAPEQLGFIASKGELVLAIDEAGKVVGTAAVTLEYPGDIVEFGGWAVEPELVKHGVGMALLLALVHNNGLADKTVVAFANDNSGPIFKKLGAQPLDQSEMHPSAFEPCQTCACDKSGLAEGQKCVDTIYNLTPVILGMIAGE